MAFLSRLDISLSGMMAQRLRMDVISQNVANAETTNIGDGTPYRRQITVMGENLPYKNIDTDPTRLKRGEFGRILSMTLEERRERMLGGVKVMEVVEDETPFTPVYDPSHPDANEEGYYYLPNVDVQEEQMDALAATTSHNANYAMYDAMLTMTKKALTIGK